MLPHHQKSPVFTKETEFVVKNLPTKETTGPDGIAGEPYRTFRKKCRHSLQTSPPRTEVEGTLPSSSYEAKTAKT